MGEDARFMLAEWKWWQVVCSPSAPNRVAVRVQAWFAVANGWERGKERGSVYFMRSGRVVLWEVGVRGGCSSSLSRRSLRIQLMRKGRACLKLTRQAGSDVHPPELTTFSALCRALCEHLSRSFCRRASLYNVALVVQQTMQHVRALHSMNSFPRYIPLTAQARRCQVARVKLLISITPLWHDARRQPVSTSSRYRDTVPGEAQKILAALSSAQVDSLEPP
jgi:hypothetical protein